MEKKNLKIESEGFVSRLFGRGESPLKKKEEDSADETNAAEKPQNSQQPKELQENQELQPAEVSEVSQASEEDDDIEDEDDEVDAEVAAHYHKGECADYIFERLKLYVRESNPYEQIDDDTEFCIKAKKIVDDIIDENRRTRAEYERMFNIISEQPEIAVFISELMKGTPVSVALIRADIHDIEPSKHDLDYEEYMEAIAERRKKLEIEQEKERRRKTNTERTRNNSKEFFELKKLDDKEVDEFAEYIEKVVHNILDGDIDKNILERLYKGYSFENQVAKAKEAGAVEERNNSIMVNRKKNLISDGLPGSGGGATPSTTRMGYIERIMKGV